jgi:ABC-type polysaccharide transport system permease subunit
MRSSNNAKHDLDPLGLGVSAIYIQHFISYVLIHFKVGYLLNRDVGLFIYKAIVLFNHKRVPSFATYG